ncbi:MAG: class I poly(R)-hydroxyalkanoic acid synthase, partial [Pseudomonadota bacterium]
MSESGPTMPDTPVMPPELETASAPAADIAAPAGKRAKRRQTGKARAAVKKAEAAPKPAPAPPPQVPAADQSLSTMMLEQTADSLAALSMNLTEAITRANQVFSTAFLDQSQNAPAAWQPDPFNVQGALGEVWGSLAQQPETLRDAHAELWRRYAEIWERHTAYMITGTTPPADPGRDRRFKDPEWRSNPAFSMLRETYLATADFINGLVARADGVDEATKRKATFFIKQAVDAASPSNFLMTNPTALRALLQTHGQSLLQGIENLANDLKRGHGALAISQADLTAFKLGENVATSKGDVVFRNEILELIQYAPTTENVHKAPLL